MAKTQITTAAEAASLVKDGMTVMVGGFMRGQVARIHLRWTRPRLRAKVFRSGGTWPPQMDDSAISSSSSGRSD